MRKTDKEERIDLYVKGQMNAEEKNAFLQELSANETLAHEVELAEAIRDGIIRLGEKRKMMAEMRESYELAHFDDDNTSDDSAADRTEGTEQTPLPNPKPNGGWRRWLVPTVAEVAACAAVAFFAISPLQMRISLLQQETALLEKRLETQEVLMKLQEEQNRMDSIVRSSKASSGHLAMRGGSFAVDSITNLLDSQRYDQALALINSELADNVLPSEPMEPEEREYLEQLQKVQAEELQWLKVRALLGIGRLNEATAILRQFASRDGEHHEEAIMLLQAMGLKP